MTADRFIMGGMPDNDYHDAMEKRLAAPTEQTEAQDDGAADTRNLRATVDSCANPPEIPDSSIDSPYAKWPRSRIHDVMDALRCITDWAYKNGHGEVGYEPEEVLRVWLINAWVDLESARSAMTVMVKERDACCDETRSAVRQVFADAEQVKALRADLAQKMQEHQDALSEMRGRMEGAERDAARYRWLREHSFANSDRSLPYVRRDRKNEDGEEMYRILHGEGLDQLIDASAGAV